MSMMVTRKTKSPLDDENYILLGVAKLDDINEQLGIDIESEDYDSIAGHIINLFWIIFQKPENVFLINMQNISFYPQRRIVLIK